MALLRPEVSRRSAVVSGARGSWEPGSPSCAGDRLLARPARCPLEGRRPPVGWRLRSGGLLVGWIISRFAGSRRSCCAPSARARLQRGARVWDADATDPARGLDPQPRPLRLRVPPFSGRNPLRRSDGSAISGRDPKGRRFPVAAGTIDTGVGRVTVRHTKGPRARRRWTPEGRLSTVEKLQTNGRQP